MTLRGMAWDHPRAYQPLEAFAKECPCPAATWDRQSLADFEARPITELARQYDLMIIDHPGLGAAIAAGAIQPLRRLVPQEVLDGWKASSFGPTWNSYVVGGQPWALPVDAATQVSVLRPDLLGPDLLPVAPRSWAEVPDLAREHRVALCLGGPHAFLAVLTLDRPDKLNSVTTAMSQRLFGLIGEIGSDDAVRAVVLTGAGPRSFCVGSDIAEVDAYPDPWRFRNRRDYCDALRALRKPVIAAVNGYAYGGGVSALLAASVPAGDAALLLLTGDPVDAAEARRIGLVSRLYEPAELVQAARALAATIAARPPIAAQAAKANLLAARSMALEQAIQYERGMQAICMGTRDAAEGRSAFAEKRSPRFTGH